MHRLLPSSTTFVRQVGHRVTFRRSHVSMLHGWSRSKCRPLSLSGALRPVVAPLAALLRVAEGLDRSHFGVVRDVEIAGKGKDVTVRVRTGGHDAELELWAARRKADLFEETFDARVAVEVEE